MAAEKESQARMVSQNRRARFDYFIQDTVEAGLVLMGSEVKSLRRGQASLSEAFAAEREGDIWLLNAHIPEYLPAKHFGHVAKRPRKLLLHKRQIEKLSGQIKREGITLVPVSLFFNDRGIAKLSLGVAKGKRQVDKRETSKQRDWQRDKARLMRDRG